MSDTPPLDDTDMEPHHGSITGLPRWVKVSGIVVVVLVLLFVILQLTGVEPGGHDPGGRGDHGLGDDAPAVDQEQAVAFDDSADRPLPALVPDVDVELP